MVFSLILPGLPLVKTALASLPFELPCLSSAVPAPLRDICDHKNQNLVGKHRSIVLYRPEWSFSFSAVRALNLSDKWEKAQCGATSKLAKLKPLKPLIVEEEWVNDNGGGRIPLCRGRKAISWPICCCLGRFAPCWDLGSEMLLMLLMFSQLVLYFMYVYIHMYIILAHGGSMMGQG